MVKSPIPQGVPGVLRHPSSLGWTWRAVRPHVLQSSPGSSFLLRVFYSAPFHSTLLGVKEVKSSHQSPACLASECWSQLPKKLSRSKVPVGVG